MMTKLAVALALTVVAVVRSDVTKHADDRGKHHSLILGQRRDGDSLIHTEVVRVLSKLLQIVKTNITFPSNGAENNKTINFLQVLDRNAKGHGGSSYVINGGPGDKYVVLGFKSQRGHGLNFIVYIYGYDN